MFLIVAFADCCRIIPYLELVLALSIKLYLSVNVLPPSVDDLNFTSSLPVIFENQKA